MFGDKYDVILQRDYEHGLDYIYAVAESVKKLMLQENVEFEPDSGPRKLRFLKEMRGVDVLASIEIGIFRIYMKISFCDRVPPERQHLVSYYCEKQNLRAEQLGFMTLDQSSGELTFQNTVCYYGAFSEWAFLTYWTRLKMLVWRYAAELVTLLTAELSEEYEQINTEILLRAAENLPSSVKLENIEKFIQIRDILGETTMEEDRLINFLVERVNQ